MNNAVEAINVSMKFNMSKDKVDSLKEYFIKLAKHELHYEEFYALTDVSFSVARGEVFGMVGLNGSGKSTMLKIISGIMKPTKGKVVVNGSVSPLIELGAGFDKDLTARENVFLNGAVLGYSRARMAAEYDEIIEFAELQDFQDVAIKNFSSGMKARLGFSIATITKPDILIVDEILSVGDFLFKQKSENRIKELMGEGTTVLLVSHTIKQIRSLCSHAIWLNKGQKILDGPANEVCDVYEETASNYER